MKSVAENLRDLTAQLAEAAEFEQEDRMDALIAEIKLYRSKALPYLKPLLNQSDTDIQLAAVFALEAIGGKAVVKELNTLVDQNGLAPTVLEMALQVLIQLNSRSSIPKFLRALNHPDRDVRVDAIHALSGVREKKALPLLEEIAAQASGVEAQEARTAIVNINQGLDGLLEVWNDTTQPYNLRSSALSTISHHSPPLPALEALVAIAEKAADNKVMIEALDLIFELVRDRLTSVGVPENQRAIILSLAKQIALSSASDNTTRLIGVCLLRELGGEESLNILKHLAMNDPYDGVRTVSEQAIQRIENKK